VTGHGPPRLSDTQGRSATAKAGKSLEGEGFGPELETPRLVLRRWRASDREPFAELNADPEVMRHFVEPLTREQSDSLVDRIEAGFDEHGFGLWAVEVPGAAAFIGFTGIVGQTFTAHFTPAIEVGWRLARRAWGRGYATEAATAALDHAFDAIGLDEVVSITTPGNAGSRAVMERLGMTRDPSDDFDHPNVPEAHAYRRHVLYRISADQWRSRRATD